MDKLPKWLKWTIYILFWFVFLLVWVWKNKNLTKHEQIAITCFIVFLFFFSAIVSSFSESYKIEETPSVGQIPEEQSVNYTEKKEEVVEENEGTSDSVEVENTNPIGKSTFSKVEEAMKSVEGVDVKDLDVSIWNLDFSTFADENSNTPYYMVVNDLDPVNRTCEASKRMGYNLAKYVYTHEDLKNNISELRFNSGGAVYNLMREDGNSITSSNVWSGPTNFWRTFETTGLDKNLGQGSTWGTLGEPQCTDK